MAGKLPRLLRKELSRLFLGLGERKDREPVRVARVVRRAERLVVLLSVAAPEPGNDGDAAKRCTGVG